MFPLQSEVLDQFIRNLLKGKAVVDFGKPELPLDIGFGKASDHILPMIFRLTGNVLDQTANIENVIFLLFSHGYVHSFQTSGNAEH